MRNLISRNNKKSIKSLLVLLTCLLIVLPSLPALPEVEAQSSLYLYGYATPAPTINGIVGASEWNDADTVSLGSFGPSDIYSGTLYMMNDDTNLYVAVVINGDPDYAIDDWIYLYFDNDDGGETFHEEGDDSVDFNSLVGFRDSHWNMTDGVWRVDNSAAGTIDGNGAASRVVSSNHFELSHPLNSGDDGYDFSLSAGDTVGFVFKAMVEGVVYDFASEDLGTPDNPSTFPDYIVAGKPTLTSGAGVPTIDGSMGTGEWDAADSADIVLQASTTRVARGTVYVMNDATNLYLLVVIEDEYNAADNIRINFDNDNGGGLNPSTGDDGLENSGYLDDFYYDAGGSVYHSDTSDSGTNDGEGDANHDGSKWYFECSHPLDTSDNSHDFSLSIGNTVGFGISYWDYSTYCNWPLTGNRPDNYAEITIASPRFVGMLNFDDYANRMGSMPGVEPSTTLYFPHFHRDSNWQTFYALVNPGTSNTDVDVTYYASDGSTISTESFSLDPGHKTGKFPPTGSGWIKVVSDVPIVGMLNFDDYANRMGSMPGVTPASTIYFPHFHRDSSWQTFFALVNPQGSSASIDITYYASDGSTIDTESFTLDAGHKTGKFTPSGSGWIKVVSSQPIVGMLNFDDYRNRMGSMPGVTASTTLYFPHFDQGSSWQSYGAIVNPGSTASVTTTFYANDGSIIGSGTDSVGPNCKIGGFPPTGTGWIKVESSVPVVGMVNFDDYSNRMGSMPGATSLYTIRYPHFHQDSNWQTYYAIVNSGPDCGLTSAYYASDGSSTGSTSMSLPENNKAGTFPPSGNGWINAPP